MWVHSNVVRRLSLLLAALPCACSLVLDWDSRRDAAGPPASPDATSPMDAGVVDAPGDPTGGSDASDGGCPPGMVAATGYCIDATEVTNAAYAEFLAANVDPKTQPAKCAANTTFTPAGSTFTANDLPVVNVDWCDAFAYCAWAGKRLCGKIGGGSLDTLNARNGSQWFEACSMSGARTYPYGTSYDEDACQTDADRPVAVGSKASCTGALPGLFDMSGNVAEWEDACESDGPGARCAVRGGSFESEEPSESSCAAQGSQPRNEQNREVGFRCCTP